MKQVTNEDYNINVEQELVNKPILNSSEYLSNLFIEFSSSIRDVEKITLTGIRIIRTGSSLFINIISKKQLDRLNEIRVEVKKLNSVPINRRSKHRIPYDRFDLISEGVGIIIQIADMEGLIIREKQIRENTVIGIDGGFEGFAPASKNIVEQSKEVFDKYNENQ